MGFKGGEFQPLQEFPVKPLLAVWGILQE